MMRWLSRRYANRGAQPRAGTGDDRGHSFWQAAGGLPPVAANYQRALSLASSTPERRFLQRKLGECAVRKLLTI